eukprot:5737867-Prymnesium_polylepis.1
MRVLLQTSGWITGRCGRAARRPPCRARESDARTVLSAPPSPCSTSCVIGRYHRAVRALDGGGGGWQQEVARACLRGRQQSGPLREPSTFDHPFVGSMMSPTANGA